MKHNDEKLKTTTSQSKFQRWVSFAQWIPGIGVFLAPTIPFFTNYESIIDDHFLSSLIWHVLTSCILVGLLLRMAS